MSRLQWVLAVTAFSSSKAMVDSSDWVSIKYGNGCLATEQARIDDHTSMYSGAAVFLADCDQQFGGAVQVEWSLNYNTSDHSLPFDIRVGARKGGNDPMTTNGVSKWCLDAHDLNSDSAALSIQECNGSLQQQFMLDIEYDGSTAYVGGISLTNGKCMDATTPNAAGSVPTAQTCNGDQIWGICATSESSSSAGTHFGTTCATTPAPEPTPGDRVQIRSSVSDLCVDLPGGDTSNGALLWTWECFGLPMGDAQQWTFQDGQLVYLPDPSKCMDLLGGNATNGNMLGIWDCYQGDSQLWGFDSEMGTIYLASSAGSDATKCIQISGENQGDPLVIWDCTAEAQQVWTVGPFQNLLAVV